MKFQPFDYPEIETLLGELIVSLFNESGRGAILIATSHVDHHLTKLIEATLPQNLSKKHKEKLFKYPGHLSSFAAKIELAYVFRLINKNLYECLNALRGIRNDAAHSPSKFELHELNEKLKSIYNLGPGFSNFIKEVSTKIMLNQKFEELKTHLDKSGLSEEDQAKIVKEIIDDKEKLQNLEKQVPFWELVSGLCFLCGLIVYYKESNSKLTCNISTLSDLLKNKI